MRCRTGLGTSQHTITLSCIMQRLRAEAAPPLALHFPSLLVMSLRVMDSSFVHCCSCCHCCFPCPRATIWRVVACTSALNPDLTALHLAITPVHISFLPHHVLHCCNPQAHLLALGSEKVGFRCNAIACCPGYSAEVRVALLLSASLLLPSVLVQYCGTITSVVASALSGTSS